jgi:predicted acylesterase/phospholipase RssA
VWALSFVCALGAATPSAVRAQATALPSQAISLTLSGGVSLGVYQAGYLYMWSEAIKRSAGRYRLVLVTGASAGSANGLIAAMTSCQPPNDDPGRDLGWLTWIDVGYRNLFVPGEVTPVSIFTRTPLVAAVERVRAAWNDGLRVGCEVVVGVTATRLDPIEIVVHEELAVPRQVEKFAFLLRGRGPGRPPQVTNYVDPFHPVRQVLLPFRPDEPRRDFDLVRSLVFASGAFPVAFSPQPIEHCLQEPHSPAEPLPDGYDLCDRGTQTAAFVDGGVFDNNPLRFAHALARAGLRVGDDGAAMWRDLAVPIERERRPGYGQLLYTYLDPDTTAFPPMSERGARPPADRLLVLFARMLGDFVESARANELYELIAETPTLRERMRLTRRNYPAASTHLNAFIGFFERDFRVFDYYLGMYDAYVSVREQLPDARLPFDLLAARDGDAAIAPRWRPFACMVGWFDDDAMAPLRRACLDPALRNFRILLQVALDRLHAHCRRSRTGELGIAPSRHCVAASRGAPRPLIEGVEPIADAAADRGRAESHFMHTMRLLAAYEFEFRDLGLAPDEAWLGRVAIRRKLLKMARFAVKAQPELVDRWALLKVARNAINRIAYEPPRHWMYIALGSQLEVGGSVLPFDWNHSWARLNLSAQLDGVETLLTRSADEVGLYLALGPELELLPVTSPVVQPIVGARAGYHASSRDRGGFDGCDERRSLDDARTCSQPVAQLYAAIAILERLRLQVTATWGLGGRRAYDDKRFDLALGVGWQLLD